MDASNNQNTKVVPRPSISVGYVGNLLGRYVLGQWGSGLILALSGIPRVRSIDIFCPGLEGGLSKDPIDYPSKVRIRTSYDLMRPVSVLSLLGQFRRWKGDLLIFNMNSTSFGSRSVSNLAGLSLPFAARFLLRKKVVVIYHSSVLTSDIAKLGYGSGFNRIRAGVLSVVEGMLFRFVPSFVLLAYYRDVLDRKIPGGRIRVFRNQYLDGIPTIALNHIDTGGPVSIGSRTAAGVPTFLLHGYWGPQKDLAGILRTLATLREEGLRFNLTLSGTINPHFPEYAEQYSSLVRSYSDLITTRMDSVPEVDIARLMTETDLLILPYNASGGHSGVLEIASCFDLPTLVIDFPEYREQAAAKPSVVLCRPEEMMTQLRKLISTVGSRSPRSVDFAEKIRLARECADSFLDEAAVAQ